MQFSDQRRKTLALLAVAAVPSWAVPSAPAAGDSAGKPYQLISPVVTGDKNRIRFFFSYDCPYCRSYHNGLMQWGASLPKPFVFDATPVITSIDNNNLPFAVYGRLVAQALAPKNVAAYDFMMYSLIQGDAEAGIPPKQIISLDDVFRTLVKSGVDFKAMQDFLKTKGDAIQKQIPEHGLLLKTYGLTVTPAVALVGRYMVSPDNANGNPQQFLLLLNGLVSRIMQGGANAL